MQPCGFAYGWDEVVKSGRFYAFRRGRKACMNSMYRENALDYKASMFCT